MKAERLFPAANREASSGVDRGNSARLVWRWARIPKATAAGSIPRQDLRRTRLAIRPAVFLTTFLAVCRITFFVVFLVGLPFLRIAFFAAFRAGFRARRFFSISFIISAMTIFSMRLANLISCLDIFFAAARFFRVAMLSVSAFGLRTKNAAEG